MNVKHGTLRIHCPCMLLINCFDHGFPIFSSRFSISTLSLCLHGLCTNFTWSFALWVCHSVWINVQTAVKCCARVCVCVCAVSIDETIFYFKELFHSLLAAKQPNCDDKKWKIHIFYVSLCGECEQEVEMRIIEWVNEYKWKNESAWVFAALWYYEA